MSKGMFSRTEVIVWVEGTFKDNVLQIPLPWAETSFTRSGCSKLHPAWTPKKELATFLQDDIGVILTYPLQEFPICVTDRTRDMAGNRRMVKNTKKPNVLLMRIPLKTWYFLKDLSSIWATQGLEKWAKLPNKQPKSPSKICPKLC